MAIQFVCFFPADYVVKRYCVRIRQCNNTDWRIRFPFLLLIVWFLCYSQERETNDLFMKSNHGIYLLFWLTLHTLRLMRYRKKKSAETRSKKKKKKIHCYYDCATAETSDHHTWGGTNKQKTKTQQQQLLLCKPLSWVYPAGGKTWLGLLVVCAELMSIKEEAGGKHTILQPNPFISCS